MSVWMTSFEPSWAGNLNLAIGGLGILGRNILLLVLVPWLVLPRRKSRLLIFYSLMLVATVLNPLAGRWVMKMVTPASYWRFIYLLPLPLCAGLLARCFLPGPSRFGRVARVGGGLLTLAVTIYAYQASALADCQFKRVWAYKLPQNEMILARKSAHHLGSHAVVLAAEDPAWVMSLLDPSLRFSSIRAVETVHVFKNGKRTEEGIQRVQAQRLVTDGERPRTTGSTTAGSPARCRRHGRHRPGVPFHHGAARGRGLSLAGRRRDGAVQADPVRTSHDGGSM